MKPFLILTPGDPDGIGPEITWKALQNFQPQEKADLFTILCVGAREPFDRLKAPIHLFDPALPLPQSLDSHSQNIQNGPNVWLYPSPTTCSENRYLPGFQAGWSIERATQLVLQLASKKEGASRPTALVTGPIHKERLQKGGYLYPGHTEFLADLCGVAGSGVTMMLANSQLRVSLVTTHLSIQNISQKMTRAKIRKTVLQTFEGLKTLWKIPHPRIAVTALNPHGGESGLFGNEEIDIIVPEIEDIQKHYSTDFDIQGPFPADTLFAKQIALPLADQFDAVVCMYHDQGLIPVKLLDFDRTVNITLGLPIIRTSVDHGVGFDIVGKGIANPSSLQAAIEVAALMGQQLTRQNENGETTP